MKISNRCLTLSFLSVWSGFYFFIHHLWLEDALIQYMASRKGYGREEINDLYAYGIYNFFPDFSMLIMVFIFLFGWIFILRTKWKMKNLAVLYFSSILGWCILAAGMHFDHQDLWCFYQPKNSIEFYEQDIWW